MENADEYEQIPGEESSFSFPRGGPIFVNDLVSPLTRVSDFESDVFHELESLKAELGSESTHLEEEEEEDISVDELKIYSDEELVREAMQIAFEGDEQAGSPSELADNPIISGAEDDHRMMDADTSTSCESSETSYDGENGDANSKKRKKSAKNKAKSKKGKTSAKDKVNSKKSKKSARNKANWKKRTRELIVRENYNEINVEHLAKRREKQEEDKASVKLHSFNRRKQNNAALPSGNVDTLKCLLNHSVKVKCSQTEKHVPIQYPEVVLCVEVYHNKQSWKKTQEILVLGCQFLTELRDKIRCLTDVVMQKAEEYDPSGYFLIEEVFCNDMRDPSAINYSEPIFNWLRNSKDEALAKWNCILSGGPKNRKALLGNEPVSKLPNFRSVDMEKTRFRDLGFRLGAGYLYCHQGDCKHTIVIRDMRLIHPDDVQNRAAYPLLVYQPKVVLRKCSVCRIYKATKVTLDDKWAGENPCYFCENCYYLLHYSEDGTLLYDQFVQHDYLQDYY